MDVSVDETRQGCRVGERQIEAALGSRNGRFHTDLRDPITLDQQCCIAERGATQAIDQP